MAALLAVVVLVLGVLLALGIAQPTGLIVGVCVGLLAIAVALGPVATLIRR